MTETKNEQPSTKEIVIWELSPKEKQEREKEWLKQPRAELIAFQEWLAKELFESAEKIEKSWDKETAKTKYEFLKLHLSNTKAWMMAIQKLQPQKELAVAEKSAEQIQKEQTQWDKLIKKAQIAEKKWKTQDALEYYEQITKEYPSHQKIDQVKKRAEELSAKLWNDLFSKATQATKEWKTDDAIELYEKLIEQYPYHKKYNDSLLNVAGLYFKTEQKNRKEKWFWRTVWEAFNTNKNLFINAVDNYKKFLESNPSSQLKAFVYYQSGEAYLQSVEGQPDRNHEPAKLAEQCFLSIIEEHKDSAFYKPAIEWLKRARTALTENQIFAWDTYMKMGEYRAAKSRFQYVKDTFADILEITPTLANQLNAKLAEATDLNIKFPKKDPETKNIYVEPTITEEQNIWNWKKPKSNKS